MKGNHSNSVLPSFTLWTSQPLKSHLTIDVAYSFVIIQSKKKYFTMNIVYLEETRAKKKEQVQGAASIMKQKSLHPASMILKSVRQNETNQ